MKILAQFSGEHPMLPRAEFEAVLGGEGLRYRILSEDAKSRLVLAEVKARDAGFVGRLALVKKACEFVASSGSLEVAAEKLRPLLSGKTFKVRSRSQRVAERLGGLLHEGGLTVSVREPDVLVECVMFQGEFVVGIDIPTKRAFEPRKPQHRPFFHPTSMHPKVARSLVNLSRVKSGEKVLDPFCGTGGILIEAALMGFTVVGCDIDERMVEGCRNNLRHFGVSGVIKKGDALACDIRADAVVTDPPYGRASHVGGGDSRRLYQSFIEHASELLVQGRFLVLVAPKEYELSFPGFKVDASYDLRMHKSLTRRIWVLRKK